MTKLKRQIYKTKLSEDLRIFLRYNPFFSTNEIQDYYYNINKEWIKHNILIEFLKEKGYKFNIHKRNWEHREIKQ